jgi:hypothetical protein
MRPGFCKSGPPFSRHLEYTAFELEKASFDSSGAEPLAHPYVDSNTAQNIWDQHLRRKKAGLMKVDCMGAFIRTFAPLQSMLHRLLGLMRYHVKLLKVENRRRPLR